MTASGRVLSYGEILLRASPGANGHWLSAHSLPVYLGGAECNVAHALALWGIPVSYFSALPANYMSDSIRRHMEARGIDTSRMPMLGDRIGIYFLEQGADLKHRGVIYDRANSSFASLQPGMVDWDKVLDRISWFHFSAISPALNQTAAGLCREVLEAASAKGITISVDLNYRAKLWQYGKRPLDVMPELTAYADVVMGNLWAANTMLGTKLHQLLIDKNSQEAYLEHAAKTSEEIAAKFPRCRVVANTFRFTEGAVVDYYAALYHRGENVHSPVFHSAQVSDTVGSGDCFMAGLIRGQLRGIGPQEVVNFAAAAAFGKLHVIGDTTTQTEEEIQQILEKHAGKN